MAEAHERSAYHRFKISDPLYDLTRMDPDESDLAWTGPSPVDQPYDYLKSKERAEYYAEKEKKFLQANPDWDKYDPEKDEFLHPGVSGEAGWSGGWRKNHGGSEQNGRSRGMKSGRGGRSGRLQNASRRAKQAEDGADMISIKANRKGLGYFTYDPIPKPVHDWVPWIKQLPGPEDTQGWDEKAVDWDEKFNVPEDESRRRSPSVVASRIPIKLDNLAPPLDAKIDANCFTWGQKFANWAHLNAKETEKMFLFLAVRSFFFGEIFVFYALKSGVQLPTIVKVERVELLAARLSDPNNRPLVVDETQYWNISPPPPSKPNPDLTTKGC